MHIEKLSSTNYDKGATVSLSYDEIRCIANALYELHKYSDIEKDSNFNTVYRSFVSLFALVKHGFIPEHELEIMHNLLQEEKERAE